VRAWKYLEPGEHGGSVEHTVTEAEILTTFYPWWVGRMQRVGKLLMATPQNCIEDWCVVHWAEEVVVASSPQAPEKG